jgi:hypothetical protein
MVVELRERFHVREKELNKRENTLMAREDDVVAAERALGRTRMECDAERDWVKAVRHDYWAWFCTSTISQQCSLDFDWVLCGCQFTLSVWDMDLGCGPGVRPLFFRWEGSIDGVGKAL